MPNSIEQNIWGFTPEGEAVVLYTMTNGIGASVQLVNIGAAVVSITVPGRDGNLGNVALGYNAFDSYFDDAPAMGKTAGRFANRIAYAQFTLDGKKYHLSQNAGQHHLHGGPKGFANRLWNSRVETDRVVFSLFSPDGDEKYPGDLSVETVYDWNDECELEITFFGKSEAPTIINLTNHTYFNLRGENSGSKAMLEQKLQLNASRFLDTDATQIPTGILTPVAGTPMDFTTAKPIGQDIAADYEPLRIGAGYDHCWAVDNWEKGKLSDVGVLSDDVSGRRMVIRSTQPGAQVYTGNWLKGCPPGREGQEYDNRDGVAVECQAYPNSPNIPEFPSTVLRPDEIYHETIVYRFETLK